MPRPCEFDAYANPADHVDRLGRVFATLKIRERYDELVTKRKTIFAPIVAHGDGGGKEDAYETDRAGAAYAPQF